MRRTIAFITRHRATPNQPVLRLFVMDDRQARWFARACASITALSGNPWKSNELVEHVVVHFLQGKEPGMGSPKSLLLGRSLFPVLTDSEVAQLPRSGAPRGRITSLVFQLEVTPKDKPAELRTVRFDMTRDQADAYNIALFDLQEEHTMTRDDAWHTLNTVVARLLQGATLTETANDTVRRLAGVFSTIDLTTAPLATEDDVRRWTFTDAPQLVVPQ